MEMTVRTPANLLSSSVSTTEGYSCFERLKCFIFEEKLVLTFFILAKLLRTFRSLQLW